MTVEQGDILAVEKMKGFFLIVSKNFFNAAEQAVLCPIVEHTFPDPLHIKIKTDEVSGVVMCEQMRLVDLRYRGYKKAGFAIRILWTLQMQFRVYLIIRGII